MTASEPGFRIEAPARLHLGFLDLNGGLGRRFGGIGMALDGLSTVVTGQAGETLVADGPGRDRVYEYARRVLSSLNLPEAVKLTVEQTIPAHAGLGSGTQLGLAVGAAVAAVFGLEVAAPELARITGRGRRSGIGVSVFDAGGVVVDGGRGPRTKVPPLVSRLPFPEDWRVILAFDHHAEGLNGRVENAVFDAVQPMEAARSATLCRSVLMGLLPALAEEDFAAFSCRVAEIQEIVGEYFSVYQGGRYTSTRVRTAVEWLASDWHLTGRGQTSWGPTGFAFVEREADGKRILDSLKNRFRDQIGMEFRICRGRNHGASVTRLGQRARYAPAPV